MFIKSRIKIASVLPHSFYFIMVVGVLDNECIGAVVFPDPLEINISMFQNYTLYCCSSYLFPKSTWILMHKELFVPSIQ